MKKSYGIAITVMLFVAHFAQASVFENFNASNAPEGTYGDVSFTSSSNGLTWNLTQCRYIPGLYTNINGKSVALKSDGAGIIQSPVFQGGLKELSFNQRAGWITDGQERLISVEIVDEDLGQTTTYDFSNAGADQTIYEIQINGLNITGSYSYKITNKTEGTIIIIDNIMMVGTEDNLETIENASIADNSYETGSFTGNNGGTWLYSNGRTPLEYIIGGDKSIMLKDTYGYIQSNLLSNGLKELSFLAVQNWIGNSGVQNFQLKVYDANDDLVFEKNDLTYERQSEHRFELFQYTISGIDIVGACSFRIVNASSNIGEIVIDNITWKDKPISTGIKDTEVDNLTVFSREKNIVIRKAGREIGKVSVYNVSGQLVNSIESANREVSIPVESKGIYLIMVSDPLGVSSSKVLVK
ncbi:Por secretion system C-terminal sorting domain-containing protein [Mariniphaga anaerophila]|uniref:Por secretion system C-terminal sorting domain-containing protein n=1 Tax=Mariniphaga anaerophila TaxID=1484053 RepID=A0A1M4SWG4_9BACT|nr:T9SS type A sorting domain-containing protein [Mariniphaga anaerophila]SHE36520.1 Por secretion system C-terminal sorting domain-containing protein [Mariniphaga anaerophila]